VGYRDHTGVIGVAVAVRGLTSLTLDHGDDSYMNE
jgi:hypothetical protein